MSTMEQAAEQFKGMFQESTDAPQEGAEETVEAAAEPTESIETEQPEQEQSTEVEAQETSEVEGADTGAESLELGAEELAELIGAKPDWLNINEEGSLNFRVKDGEDLSDVNLEQLINAYQGDANLTNRSKKIAELEKQRETALSGLVQRSQQIAQQQNTLLETLEKEFLAPYENINWQELREDDPSEYAARKQELAERRQKFSELQAVAQQSLAEANQQIAAEMQQQQQAYLMAQRDQIVKNIPTWSENVAQEVTSYLKEQGLSDEVISNTNDATAITLAYKAMLYDQGKATAEKKLKKPLPKVLKPGKRPSKTEANGVKEAQLRKTLKQTGSMEDAAAIFRQKFKQ